MLFTLIYMSSKTSKVRERNAQFLRTFARKASASVTPIIGDVLKRYKDNGIKQLPTAQHIISKLLGKEVKLRGKTAELYQELLKNKSKKKLRWTWMLPPPRLARQSEDTFPSW